MGDVLSDMAGLVLGMALWALIRYIQWRFPPPPGRGRQGDDDDIMPPSL